MSTQTTKLKLTKPSADEAVDIAVINANMDKIDAHAHAAADVSSGTLDLARLPTVSVAKGGTGKTSHTANSVLVGNGSSALKNISTANGALYATGANAAPSFGPLPIAQGGTGKTTAADAREALGAASATDLKAVQDSISSKTTGSIATSNVIEGEVTYITRNNVTTVLVNITKLANSPEINRSFTVGQLPVGSRPYENTFMTLFGLDTPCGNIYVHPNGAVNLRVYDTSLMNGRYRGSCTFVNT